MKVLVIGGTRFFGVHMVEALLRNGHQVTIATRGNARDGFGSRVRRIAVDRMEEEAVRKAFCDNADGYNYDVVCDNIAYSSLEVKYLLDAVKCRRYILTSSVSVYGELGMGTKEEDFQPLSYPLRWCTRQEYPYDEIKRQGECALFQAYPEISSAAVRFPYVVGTDDYTKRLYFYVEHVLREMPMRVDNPKAEIAFIKAEQAGEFLAWLAESDLEGPVNACSTGTITLQKVFDYVEARTGKKPVLTPDGEEAPYNGSEGFSLNTQKAEQAGYEFPGLDSWMSELLDAYIEEAEG